MAKFKIRAALAAIALIVIPQASFSGDDLAWEPSGQVTMMIGFSAGGGADSLARMLTDGLNTKYGWNVVPENVAGRGGAAMAEALKDEPADGLTVGVTVTQSIVYDSQVAMTPSYSPEDFEYLSTLTGSQVGIVAKADRGWTTLSDVIEAAKSGQKITFASMTQQFADGTYVIGKRNGVEFVDVKVQGGKGGLNAVMADDVDIAWVGGAQVAAVKAGDVIDLASGEDQALIASPNAPLLSDVGVPYSFGAKFMLIAPKGLPEEVQEAYRTAVAALLLDSSSQLNQITAKFSGPEVLQGDALRAKVMEGYEDAKALIDDASQ